MSTVVIEAQSVHIPSWVVDLQTFRSWFRSDEFPESGKICFLNGEVWVDMSREQAFTHNKLKGEFGMVLGLLVKTAKTGHYFHDGMLLSNQATGDASQPDGIFVSRRALAEGEARLLEGATEGFVEIEGSPEMVLEVVSTSSVQKDTVDLMEAYWQADVREYWLADARRAPLQFNIYRHTPKGYVATRKQGGWLKSAVFDKSFRLTQATDADGYPEFTLAVR